MKTTHLHLIEPPARMPPSPRPRLSGLKLLRAGRLLTRCNAKGEGAYFFPSAVEWKVLALIRSGLGDRSVRHPTPAVRMGEAFLCKIEAAARRIRAAFGETQEKLLLDYR